MHTNGNEMYKESVVHVQSCVLLIRPTDFFGPFHCCHCVLLHDFVFCLSKQWILMKALLLALAKSLLIVVIIGDSDSSNTRHSMLKV